MKTAVVFKEENKKANDLYPKLTAYLKANNVEVLPAKEFKKADYFITLGGDGTLIHTACQYANLNVPFVGINTGTLGFLTAAEETDWKEAIEKIIANKVFISERITLEAEVTDIAHSRSAPGRGFAHSGSEARSFLAVNEAAVKGFLRVIELEIGINGERLLKISGDGVIISTQTGSTAYSLSSGGPIVDPDLDCLLITPINPIGLPIPSIVISPKDEVIVKLVKGVDVSLIVDGQEHTKLKEEGIVKFTKGKFNVKLGYFDKQHFLKSLNAKFGLAGRSVK